MASPPLGVGSSDRRSASEKGEKEEIRIHNPYDTLRTHSPDVQLDYFTISELRLSTNFNKLFFEDTKTLEVARNQGKIDSDIGWDLSVALIYRPFFTQNIVTRFSVAYLVPGDGFKDLFGNETSYSILGNLIFTY
jgi:hypothetical protein